jgi:hypothetical protein
MSEAPDFTIQLFSDGKAVRIDIEPPLEREDKELLRNAPSARELPEDSLVFHDRTPDSGAPFTEINCAEVHTGAEYRGLKLDEANFAREIAEVLEASGKAVKLDTVIRPIEQSGKLFLSLSTERPLV